MKNYLLLLAVLVSFFYLSQNASAGTYGNLQVCYYGTMCYPPDYSTPGEVYCPSFSATYEKGYPTCTYGTKCCGSFDYCSSILAGGSYAMPNACTPATCYYNSQQDCTGGRTCGSSGCVCPSDKPNWDGTNCISCPSGTTWDSVEKKCKILTPATCSDGTLEGACCSTPGTKCKKDANSNLVCQTDPTCPNCYDTDGGQVPGTKGTCRDTVGGSCTGSGCTDTCASNGAVIEYYCTTGSQPTCMPTTISCSSTDVCQYGACGYTGGGGSSGCNNGIQDNGGGRSG